MELLYWVDRTLTFLLQSLSRLIQRRLKISIFWQSLTFSFGFVFGGNFVYNLKHKSSDGWWPYAAFAILVVIMWGICKQFFLPMLSRLHGFFDVEGAHLTDKLYDNGYRCWSGIVTTCIFLGTGMLMPTSSLGEALVLQGLCQLSWVTYVEFVNRRKGPKNRKKRVTSSALEKLIDRCRDFLPIPNPLPASE